jgi:hypothetical protein
MAADFSDHETADTVLGITGLLDFVLRPPSVIHQRQDSLESTSGYSNHGDSVTCSHNGCCNHDDCVM